LLSGPKIASRNEVSFEGWRLRRTCGRLDGLAIPDLVVLSDPIKMGLRSTSRCLTIAKGAHTVEIRLGAPAFPSVGIEVV
jgi:hypothetical protein